MTHPIYTRNVSVIMTLLVGVPMLVTMGCQTTHKASNACHHTGSGDCQSGCGNIASTCIGERPKDFSPYATPAPLGTYVNDWNDAIICSAREQQFVVSRHEWFSGGNRLGPEGREHVSALANALLCGAEEIFIEAEPVDLQYDETLEDATARIDELNEQRRVEVVSALASHGVTDADSRVALGPLDRVGVYGVEAPLIYNRMFLGGGGRRGGFGGRGQGGFGGGGIGGLGGGGFGLGGGRGGGFF